MSTVWLIASGKGGVGKSTLAAGLGVSLGREGQRVCVVDADLGLRNADMLLGLSDRVVYDLMDVAKGGCAQEQALIAVPGEEQVFLLPASQFARAKDLDPKDFRHVIRGLRESFDQILIDCPAGTERGLRGAMACEPDRTLVVATPDDVSLRDAEQLCGLIRKKELPGPQLLVNRLRPELIRTGEMISAAAAAAALDCPLLGEIPEDPLVYRALLRHLRVTDVDCAATRAFARIAQRMCGGEVPLPDYGQRPEGWLRRLFRRAPKEVRILDH